jgi:SAM-dependent methyltransferase
MTRDELKAIFGRYLEHIPTALALRETMRMVALLKRLPAGSTVLDVGCGDGSFWHVYPKREGLIIDGVDLAIHEAALARAMGVYRHVELGDISRQVPEGAQGGEPRLYDVALGNCSLEHVPDIHSAFVNIRKTLRPGGTLILFVPAFGWARTLRVVRWLERLNVRVGMAAAGALDGFFQHHHLYSQHTWQLLIEAAGYRVTEVSALGAPGVNAAFGREMPRSFLELLAKLVLKRYPRIPRRMVSAEVLDEILAQPIPADGSVLSGSQGSQPVVEYMFCATPRDESK